MTAEVAADLGGVVEHGLAAEVEHRVAGGVDELHAVAVEHGEPGDDVEHQLAAGVGHGDQAGVLLATLVDEQLDPVDRLAADVELLLGGVDDEELDTREPAEAGQCAGRRSGRTRSTRALVSRRTTTTRATSATSAVVVTWPPVLTVSRSLRVPSW